MEAICSSETSVDTQRTTRRYIPEDGTLHNHRCENLESYSVCSILQHIIVNASKIYETKYGSCIKIVMMSIYSFHTSFEIKFY
jgi:hypothetical protein